MEDVVLQLTQAEAAELEDLLLTLSNEQALTPELRSILSKVGDTLDALEE